MHTNIDNKNILVIDDSEAILLVMQTMLNEIGYHNITTTNSPHHAIDMVYAAPERFDVILTDLNMPGYDGMQVVRKLGDMGFKGAIGIISEMDKRIVELACEISRQHKVCLVGNLSKPIQMADLRWLFQKVEQLKERHFRHYLPITKEELVEAINLSQITPYYQPKLDLRNNKVTGVEVLARINRPGQVDAMLPGHFIPTAIAHQLIDRVTLQLVAKAVVDYQRLKRIFGEQIKLCFNLSPSQLSDLDYPDDLEKMLEQYQIERNRIVLEITEEFALKSAIQLESLNRLRMRGYGLSLDDFGTGYTNLHQLRSLPFTEVKIDRSLIDGLHKDKFSQVVVQSLVDIAESIGIELVAEGIEKIADFEYLQKYYNRITIQGFLLCKPRELQSLSAWHRSWVSNTA
ncbi:EAL domain-containing response regulator [Parasalinivibrio latis]|uniref:EAL domain-containing response regulator n=1 Tax=Parasalinivibrio latis TaxID=2952610 RepID=UPI0030E3EE12